MERSPHLSLRVAAENVEPSISCGVNTFVDQFAVAMKRSTSPNTGSEREPQPIETAPRDGRFLILKEDASGKFNIARWAPEAGGWVRENDEPIKITPSYWYPIQGQNDFQPRLDISTSPSEPERRAAPQRQLASDIIASRSDAASPETIVAAKTGPRRSNQSAPLMREIGLRLSRSSQASSWRHARACISAPRSPPMWRDTPFVAISLGSAGQRPGGRASNPVVEPELREPSLPAQMSQGQNTQQVDASALHIAVLQHQAEVDGVGAQFRRRHRPKPLRYWNRRQLP